jgi:hypothetical protein
MTNDCLLAIVKLQTQDPGMKCEPGAPFALLRCGRGGDFAFPWGSVIDEGMIAALAIRLRRTKVLRGGRQGVELFLHLCSGTRAGASREVFRVSVAGLGVPVELNENVAQV